MSFTDFSNGSWDAFDDLSPARVEPSCDRPTFDEFVAKFSEWASETDTRTASEGI